VLLVASLTDPLVRFATDVINSLGLPGVFALMLAESACIPIPSEGTMLFAGFNVANGHWSVAEIAIVGVAGNLVGSWIAYAIGRVGGRPLAERWGRYVLLRPHEIDRAEAWFADHGEAAVFFSRLLPVVRTFISLPAGVAEMRLPQFTVYTVAGCLPWTFALAGAGYALGASWDTVNRYFRPATIVIGALLVAALAWWVVRRLRERSRQAPQEAPGE
jgi:membrane protein DedA with SNARE-associated domain